MLLLLCCSCSIYRELNIPFNCVPGIYPVLLFPSVYGNLVKSTNWKTLSCFVNVWMGKLYIKKSMKSWINSINIKVNGSVSECKFCVQKTLVVWGTFVTREKSLWNTICRSIDVTKLAFLTRNGTYIVGSCMLRNYIRWTKRDI